MKDLSKKKIVFYPVAEEKLEPDLYVEDDVEIEKAAKIICDFTGISKDKILFFLKNFGIKHVFDNPDILGLSPAKQRLFKDLKILIDEV